jgi:hypothetical protein
MHLSLPYVPRVNKTNPFSAISRVHLPLSFVDFVFPGYQSSFPGDKAAGAWTWPLPSIYAEIKNGWRYTPTHPYVFMLWWWCLGTEYRLLDVVFSYTNGKLYLNFLLDINDKRACHSQWPIWCCLPLYMSQ